MANNAILTGHPCFNKEASKHFGRIHLAVAPKCNISCNYCNRKFDCANESRPGVTAKVLKPDEAYEHFITSKKLMPYINTVGIAGPGDSLANAEKTFTTLEKIKSNHPNVHLCLSTNGLLLSEFVKPIKEIDVTHVTVTVNAAKTSTAAKIYRRVTKDGTTLRGEEGAALLLENQYEGIQKLRENNIIVKINFIYIPGINDNEFESVFEKTSAAGANLFNVMPFIPVEKTPFAELSEPDPYDIFEAGQYIIKNGDGTQLMSHCQQCRSDAVGYLDSDCSTHKDEMAEKAYQV